ncbi:c-type cytochrome [Sandaracinobacteroides saxicola]|uniref:C-type cytochrome n=1 Tax=Sandaracinobacteroides saxicola TaxID=2759707 RepID=A0A7G5IDZ8_9SPHN|nr:c-type cytochrome [Sandaracinobacteroides saxicola]QMW21590.1 c-type cytochrome [Sandaracinobacteroides saxicola]
MSRRIIATVAILLTLAGCDGGAPRPPFQDPDGWQAKLATADPARGAALYAQMHRLSGEREALSCATCHGPQGGGNYGLENPKHIAPRLAGLNTVYVGEQLRAYANGTRVFPPMQALAGKLSSQDVADLAVNVAQLDPGPAPLQTLTPALVERGRVVWTEGVVGAATPCAQCHGKAGEGKVLRSPAIAGEPFPYIVAQLTTMHDRGRTGTTAADTMSAAVGRLRDDDLVAVAAYVASLQAREVGESRPANAPAAPTEKPNRGGV